jgi:Predicted membrane protein
MSNLNLKECSEKVKASMININDYDTFKRLIKKESSSFLKSININSKNRKNKINIQKKLDEIREKYNVGKNLDPLLYANLFVPEVINGEDNRNDEEFINIATEAMYCCRPEDMASYVSVRCNIKKSVYYWKLAEFVVYKDYYKRLGLENEINKLIEFARKEKTTPLKVVEINKENTKVNFTPISEEKLTKEVAETKDAISKAKQTSSSEFTPVEEITEEVKETKVSLVTTKVVNFDEIEKAKQKNVDAKEKVLRRIPIFEQKGSSETYIQAKAIYKLAS